MELKKATLRRELLIHHHFLLIFLSYIYVFFFVTLFQFTICLFLLIYFIHTVCYLHISPQFFFSFSFLICSFLLFFVLKYFNISIKGLYLLKKKVPHEKFSKKKHHRKFSTSSSFHHVNLI